MLRKENKSCDGIEERSVIIQNIDFRQLDHRKKLLRRNSMKIEYTIIGDYEFPNLVEISKYGRMK